MRLSKEHHRVIDAMKSAGYVWISDLSKNALMRFRYKTQHGFRGYIKVKGLTFLTSRVANMIESGSKSKDRKRLTFKQQIVALEKQLIDLEQELYVAKGVGKIKMKRKLESSN